MKNIIKRISLALCSIALLSVTAVSAFGAPAMAAETSRSQVCTGILKVLNVNNCASGGSDIGSAGDNVMEIVLIIVQWIMWAVGIICVVFIIIGGIRYATSGGDAEKVKNAKNTLLYAIIGLAIALGASIIIQIVAGLVGNLSI